MKTQRISASGRSLEDLLEEYTMLGYDAEIDGAELVVYYGRRQKNAKKQPRQDSDRWSKRERSFGYTRR